MATARPPIDPFDPIVQAMVESFESKYFVEEGLEANANSAGREFNEDFKRPYVCALMADVVSGRWAIGQPPGSKKPSQDQISESLGIPSDRSWVSDALRKGWMSMDIFMRLRCWPLKPENWEPALERRLLSDMHRHGFIAAARSYAMHVKDRPTLTPQRLDALNYELVCEMHGRLDTWLPAFFKGDRIEAAKLIHDVAEDESRDICPAWYGAMRSRDTRALVQQLTSDHEAAFLHLAQLQRDWLDIFAATDFILECENDRRAK